MADIHPLLIDIMTNKQINKSDNIYIYTVSMRHIADIFNIKRE